MNKAAIIIAPKGFQDKEFDAPYNLLKKSRIFVDVYSTAIGIAHGKLGATFNVKKSLAELDAKNYDAIIFIGGPGTPLVRADDNSLRIAREAYKNKKIIAAICWSPTILAKAGILKGKKATVWLGNDDEYGMKTSEYLEKQAQYILKSHW